MKALSFPLLALAWIAALLFLLAGGMLTYEVAARYLFVAPTIWAAELSQLCLIWGTLIAMPWLLAANRHIAVDVLTERLNRTGRRLCQGLAMAAITAFSAVVAWKGGGIFYDSFERGRTTGSMLDLPTWISELAVPVGFALLFLQALVELGKVLRGIEPGDTGKHGGVET
ncbi:TRAP transporter small permease [Roseibium sediminicola]|uniref:TRAP transporter small permease protein n=1 Tax=Roseibium sediminicola TaxID=2933272 RepID=A0ABT0H2Q8_9HYPH|nr:TRAP transporter small permease [Roseibium sp. CAU 1639]MCK7615968.1 TRAP transporter small permease [Roseibium sp. CAU 1639]